MANNKTTYTLEINAELGDLERKLGSVKNLVSGVLGSTNAPKGLEKSFEKVESLLDKIKTKASQPIDSKTGFNSISRDIDSANIALTSMLKIVNSIGSMAENAQISFLPPDTQEQINAVINALSNYQQAMTAAITETAELTTARNELAKAEEKVAIAQSKLEFKTTQLDQAKADKKAAEEAIEEIEKRKAKLAELRAEQEKIEKFYATPDADGKKKNQSKKYDGVSMRPQDIKKQIAELEKASAGDEEALEEYREALKAAKNDVSSYINQVQSARRELVASQAAYENLTRKVDELETAFKNGSAEAQEKAFKELREEAKKLGISLEDIGEAYSEEDAKELISRLSDIKTKGLKQVPEMAEKAEKGIKKLRDGCRGLKESNEDAAESFQELNDAASQQKALEDKIKSFLGVQGAAQVMRAALRDAMATITELDQTMTEMSVVTDLTVGDYWKQLPEYSQRASDLGVSINSAYEAATLYYQQGLKTNEVNAISAETLKMAKIAGLDAADATNKMTAALRGFNMELNEASAQKVADVYSELAAITAADVDEISSAMTKTASIASSAGMEFETTAAFLSQIIETTRESAETAGTAMKTVIARFQELKKAPDEIGEIDGEIVDANAIETALRSVGVELRDAGDQFRELDDVFLELSSKWNGLDKNTQRYIATIAAGSRQQSRFIAMMSDYSRTQELVTAANNSAGASNRQFEKTMESLEAKMEKLKNAWHEFTMGIMDSDLVKFGVDILTKFLEVINKATSAIGGLGGSLTKIIGILAIFKLGAKIFAKFKQPIFSLFGDIVRQAGLAGEQSGKEFQKGVEKSKTSATVPKTGPKPLPDGYKWDDKGRLHDAKGHFVTKEEEAKYKSDSAEEPTDFKTQAGNYIKDKTGFTSFKAGIDTLKGAKPKRDKLKELKNTGGDRSKRLQDLENAKSIRNARAKNLGENSSLTKEADKEVEKATQALQEYDKAQEELTAESQKGWAQIGEGIGQAGQALTGVGVTLSMVGGLLSSMGMEEAGEVISGIGQAITIVGTALSMIPPILTLISSHPIVAIVVAVLIAIIALVTTIIVLCEKASPEAKLKAAQEAANQAAEAADRAAESYDKLKESLDGLSDKYDALDNLTRGTKEWNEAVQDINNSVLDLIEEYPELAKFVENKEGVLSIDVESEEVQKALNDAEADKIIAKNSSIMANAEVLNAQNRVAYKELSDDAKFNSGNGAYAAAMTGSILAGTATGAGVGAGAGAALGATVGTGALPAIGTLAGAGLGAAWGAIIGGSIGLIGGVIGGLSAGEAAKDAAQAKDQEDTDKLAKALASGEILGTEEDISEYLVDELGYAADQADKLAERFAENAEELRDYGQGLETAESQQQAAYDAIAASAQSLANTMSFTEEQLTQSAVAVDGDISEKYYQEMMNNLEGEDLDSKDYQGEYRDELEDAIKAQYGSTAKLGENGKVTYQKDGEDVEITLSEEQMKSMIATQYATERTTAAIEYSDDAISSIGEMVGADAVNALYMASDGKALTQADLATLQEVDDTKFEEIWSKLSDNEKAVYGNDINELKKDFSDAIESATDAFEKAGDAARDFMTADMATGFKKKLDEVAEMAGGQEARQQILDSTDSLLEGRTKEEKQAIQSRINMTDWSNLESLLALQIDLEQQYGFTTEEAKAYIETLGKAAFATSGLDATIKTFGEFWKSTERINQSMTRLTKLQWEYNRALAGQGGTISKLIDEMLKEYNLQAQEYENAYHESNENISRIYAQGGLNYGVDLREAVTLGEDGINVDKTRLHEFIDSGKVSEDDANEWISNLSKQYETSHEQLEGLRSTLEGIEELEQQGRDAYYQLRDMAKETIVASLQEQIDLQQQTLDATRNANSQLINKIQEQIDDNRQARANQETEENINDLQNQHAYLSMDTSGANALELAQLDENIENAEQDYQDTLVDQAIQNLSDANEKAAEQRERQISLAQSQLDAHQMSNQFQEDIDYQLQEMLAGGTDWQSSSLGELITTHFTEGMSSTQADEWAKEIGGQVGAAESWRTTDWGETTSNIQAYLDAITENEGLLVDNLTGDAATRKTTSQVTKLRGSGFEGLMANMGIKMDSEGNISGTSESGTLSKEDEGKLDKLTQISKLDSDTNTIKELQGKISSKKALANKYGETEQAKNYDYLEKSAFYSAAELTTEGKLKYNGQEYDSYTDYLTKMNNKEVSGVENLSPRQAFGGIAVPGTVKGMVDILGNAQYETGEHFDAVVDGKEDVYVELGGKVDNSKRIALLDDIWNQTGNDSMPYVVLDAGTTGLEEAMLYYRVGAGNWRYVRDEGASDSFGENRPVGLINQALAYLSSKDNTLNYKKSLLKYKTGGLADFTGPAWLDGTPSKPEYILNAAQTERFFSLIDVLEHYDSDKKSSKSGDNYFEIEINVEKIDDDYDVEKIADKIRSMIYEDATYRNVNAINHIR